MYKYSDLQPEILIAIPALAGEDEILTGVLFNMLVLSTLVLGLLTQIK